MGLKPCPARLTLWILHVRQVRFIQLFEVICPFAVCDEVSSNASVRGLLARCSHDRVGDDPKVTLSCKHTSRSDCHPPKSAAVEGFVCRLVDYPSILFDRKWDFRALEGNQRLPCTRERETCLFHFSSECPSGQNRHAQSLTPIDSIFGRWKDSNRWRNILEKV